MCTGQGKREREREANTGSATAAVDVRCAQGEKLPTESVPAVERGKVKRATAWLVLNRAVVGVSRKPHSQR
jgi:hypothetical protein